MNYNEGCSWCGGKMEPSLFHRDASSPFVAVKNLQVESSYGRICYHLRQPFLVEVNEEDGQWSAISAISPLISGFGSSSKEAMEEFSEMFDALYQALVVARDSLTLSAAVVAQRLRDSVVSVKANAKP